jgi:alpha-glucosidase
MNTNKKYPDYMDLRKVFTLDPDRYPLNKVRQLVNYLHNHHQRYVMMVDPAVAYQNYPAFNNGVERNAFLKVSNGSVYQGVVWPGVTAFPDWFGAETQQYWNGEFDSFFNPSSGVDIDALWIDMNEASNFCAFPCSDPTAIAAASGDPPIPPPVRLSPPRPIPGFPADFQPTCVATVTFEVDATTYYGENILILGSSVTVGGGDVHSAPVMSANNYPIWSLTVQMPVNGTFTYQYVRKETDGSYTYEAHNRTVKTGDCHSGTKVVTGNITTSSGPQKRAALPPVVRSPVANDVVKRQQPGSMIGLPGRDLLNPLYTINNTAGVLSDKTINTDLIHQGGYAEYDTHNLYGTMMSATSRNALLSRKSELRPLV